MVKRLMAKVGQYEKDGQTKGRYVDLGVIMSNQNGEYALLDPSVNLAGVLLQQRVLAEQTGGKSGDRVMVSIFDNDNQRQGNSQQSGGGYDSGPSSSGGSPNLGRDLDDDVPF